MTVGVEQTYSGKLLLAVLGVLLTLSAIWEPQFWWLSAGTAVFLLWRLICVHSAPLFGVTVLLMLLFGTQQLWQQHHQRQLSACDQVVLAADGYKINGDLLTGIGVTGQQKIFVTAKIANLKQQQLLKNNDHQLKLQLTDVRLADIAPATNWREFDFKKWALHRQVKQQVTAEITEISAIPADRPQLFVQHLRKKFLNSLRCRPKYCAFHLRALVAGYSESDDLEIRELLSTLGIIHLFALSGLHVDLLIRSCRWLGSRLFVPDEITRGLLLGLLPLYAIFVGLQIGILRAILLYFLRELLRFLGVKMTSLDQLAIVLLICLWLQPAALLEIGPQLSFLLSFALRLFPKSLSAWQLQLRLGYLTMLIILFWTATFNLLALIMGALFAPLFTLLILPVTILNLIAPGTCSLVEPIWQGLYQTLNQVIKLVPLQITVGRLPVLLVLVLLVFALLSFEKLLVSKLSMAGLVLSLICVFSFYKIGLYHQVTLIDIGQGDSILIQTAFPKRTMLIDTGGQLAFETESWRKRRRNSRVERVTIPYLRSQGISQLDYVLLTHQDADHIGDLAVLLEKFPVKKVVFTAGMEQNPHFTEQLKKVDARITYLPKLAGQELRDQRLRGYFVAPQNPGIGENEDSLIMVLTLDQQKWLFTGDLGREGERAILEKYPGLTADYLKVGHHGSKTSSDPAFIAHLKLQAAFISAGRNNRYHHPNQETLTTFEQQNVPYLNTAHYGMIEWYFSPLTKQTKLRTKLVGNEQISGQ